MRFIFIFTLSVLICYSHVSFGQKANKKITITGIVLDAKQKPVEGAVIFIDKVKTNSVTDQQGYYKVKVRPDAKEVLVFTLFNGASEEVINGRTSIDFIITGKSTEPLFVVDGVIVNSIDDISPQTVKSIEVLKGPAASVYGTRGANGVILITRLSGKYKK